MVMPPVGFEPTDLTPESAVLGILWVLRKREDTAGTVR